MSAIQIATEMRAHLRTYRRHVRAGDPEQIAIAKDEHCARMERLVADLVRSLGTPGPLTFQLGTRQFGRRTLQVVHRESPRGLKRA